MKQIRIFSLLAILILVVSAAGQGIPGAASQDTLYANLGKLVLEPVSAQAQEEVHAD